MGTELPKTVFDQESPEEVENHAKFLERLRGKVTEFELYLIDLAYDAAKYGHREQFRDDGTRYFEHCRETALILIDDLGIYDADMIIAALLHDMLEDNFLYNPWRLNHIFGPRAAGFIINMTKPKKGDPRFASDAERHKFYFITIFNSPDECKIIKLADRLHNTRTIGKCAPEKIARKIKETEDVYIPLCANALASDDLQIRVWAGILADKLCDALEAEEIEQER